MELDTVKCQCFIWLEYVSPACRWFAFIGFDFVVNQSLCMRDCVFLGDYLPVVEDSETSSLSGFNYMETIKIREWYGI